MKLNDVIKSLGGVVSITGLIAETATDEELAAHLAQNLVLTEGRLPVTVEEVRAQQAWLVNATRSAYFKTQADIINAACETAIAEIRAGYPDSEVLSWTKQEAEARAFVADASAATPLLDALAAARAVPKVELAARVIAKADAFAAISGALIGKRQALEDALNALPADATAEQVAAIVW